MRKFYILSLLLIIIAFVCSSSQFLTSQNTFLGEEPVKFFRIKWKKDQNSIEYIVQLSEDPMFRWDDEIHEFPPTENNYIDIGLPFGTFYLRIAGVTEKDIRGAFSEVIRVIVENNLAEHIDNIEEEKLEGVGVDDFSEDENLFDKDYYTYIKIINDPNESINESIDDLNVVPDYEHKIGKPMVLYYPEEIFINLYYYIGISHYHNKKTEKALKIFDVINKTNPSYEPQYKVEPQPIELENGITILYSEPTNYILDETIVNFINSYLEYAKEMETQEKWRKAALYYKTILSIDPYNPTALNKIESLKKYLTEDD
jgi:tetratricopeptide (TPR) repeat protein